MTCTYVVGRYRPPGNYKSQFADNVVKGSFNEGKCSDLEKDIQDIDAETGTGTAALANFGSKASSSSAKKPRFGKGAKNAKGLCSTESFQIYRFCIKIILLEHCLTSGLFSNFSTQRVILDVLLIPSFSDACSILHAVQDSPILLMMLFMNFFLCYPLAHSPSIVSFLFTRLRKRSCLAVFIFISALSASFCICLMHCCFFISLYACILP